MLGMNMAISNNKSYWCRGPWIYCTPLHYLNHSFYFF